MTHLAGSITLQTSVVIVAIAMFRRATILMENKGV